jgi:hypothetical protein
MNDKLKTVRKEVVEAKIKALLSICLEGLRKITKNSVRMAGLPAKISNWTS